MGLYDGLKIRPREFALSTDEDMLVGISGEVGTDYPRCDPAPSSVENCPELVPAIRARLRQGNAERGRGEWIGVR
jgi:hypothetical protein